TGERLDAEASKELRTLSPAAVRHVVRDRHVREEGVVLEDEPDRPLLRPEVDVRLAVEPQGLAERDPARVGAGEPGDRSQHRALAGAGRAGQRDDPVELEREL